MLNMWKCRLPNNGGKGAREDEYPLQKGEKRNISVRYFDSVNWPVPKKWDIGIPDYLENSLEHFLVAWLPVVQICRSEYLTPAAYYSINSFCSVQGTCRAFIPNVNGWGFGACLFLILEEFQSHSYIEFLIFSLGLISCHQFHLYGVPVSTAVDNYILKIRYY